jgi:hypothetical protein
VNFRITPFKIVALAMIACLFAVAGLSFLTPHETLMLGTAGGATMDSLMKGLDGIEAKLKSMAEAADGQVATLGKVSADTKTALDSIGKEQLAMAERLLLLEQKGVARRTRCTRARKAGVPS